VKTNEKMKSKM